MKKDEANAVHRRGFLKSAAVGAAALVANPMKAGAQQSAGHCECNAVATHPAGANQPVQAEISSQTYLDTTRRRFNGINRCC